MSRVRPGLLVLAILLAIAPSVEAHANLLSSDPPRGARLDAPPSLVTVRLTERVDPAGSGLEVFDSSGSRVDQDNLRLENGAEPVLRISLPIDLPPGAYAIRWFALSTVDQHTTSGTIGFAVGAHVPPPSTDSETDTFEPSTWTARLLVYAGLSLALAGAAFAFWIDPWAIANRRDELYLKAVRIGAFSHFVGVALLAWSTWRSTGIELGDFLSGSVGTILLVRLGAAVAAVAFLLVPRNVQSRLVYGALAALLIAGAGSSRFGHASTQGFIAIGTQFLHLLSIAIWVGALALYLWLLARSRIWAVDPFTARNLGHRFSVLAMASVIVMAVTGTLLSAWILGAERLLHPVETAQTLYGRVLWGKILLAFAMVGVASVNRYVFLAHENDWKPLKAYQQVVGKASGGRFAPLEHGASQNVFRSLVGAEAAMGVCVLFLAAFLTTLGAPYAPTSAQPLKIQAAGDDFRADVLIDPYPGAGAFSQVVFHLNSTFDGQPMVENSCGRESCVTLFLTLGNGTEERTAMLDEGRWTVTDLLFVSPGNYTVAIGVQTASVFMDRIEFELVVDAR